MICFRLERQAEELQRIMAVRAETGEMVTTLKWQEVDKKVKHQRLKLVKNVVSFLQFSL